MSGLFTQSEIDAIGDSGNVARAIFIRIEDVDGEDILLHNGEARFEYEGETWLGLTDPIGGRLVTISGFDEPEFGQAASITLTMSGADNDFMKYMRSIRNDIQGKQCDVYWAAFDDDEKILYGGLKKIFQRGRVWTPTFHLAGILTRTISLTVESIWDSMNNPTGHSWNSASHQKRYPGDKFFDYAGVKVLETPK